MRSRSGTAILMEASPRLLGRSARESALSAEVRPAVLPGQAVKAHLSLADLSLFAAADQGYEVRSVGKHPERRHPCPHRCPVGARDRGGALWGANPGSWV